MLHIEDIAFKRDRKEFSVIITMPMGRHDVFTIHAEARTVYVEGRYAEHETSRIGHAYIKEEQKGEFDMTIPLPVMVDFKEGRARIFKGKLHVWFPYADEAASGRQHIRF